VATGRATWREVFYTKPPHVRKILQEDITALRHEWSESIWLDTFTIWLIALFEIVGVDYVGIAVTDLRFLVEMRRILLMGGKILHLEAPDQQANIAPELRGHCSETELQSPEVLTLRDAYIYNDKTGIDKLIDQGRFVLDGWGWL
jgi:hypothetical protein